MLRFKNLINNMKNAIGRPEMRILPGQLAFFFVLSIIPLIAVLGTLVSSLSVTTTYFKEVFLDRVPNEVETLLLPLFSGKTLNLDISLFYITSFLLASNGTHSMIIASNELYKINCKSYLFRRIKSLFMTIILVLLLVFVLLVPAFGDSIVAFIITLLNNDALIDTIQLSYGLLKYPISLISIYVAIKLLYTIAPDAKIRSKDTTYGAIFTTLGWIIATRIYSLYIGAFTSYNIFYGSISNILVLLLWVYLLAYIFVMGMAFNASSNLKNSDIKSSKK